MSFLRHRSSRTPYLHLFPIGFLLGQRRKSASFFLLFDFGQIFLRLILDRRLRS